MSAKKKLGKLIPYPLIEGGRKVIHFGPRKCQVCEAQVRSFDDTGYGFEVLERLQVVGGLRRAADECPICHSSSRERLVWFWLSQAGKGFRFAPDVTIAHFAPEKGLTKRLRSASPTGYQAYDFAPSRYRHLSDVKQADLTSLKLADGSVGLLVCNHVLEHVPDLAKAQAEIFRVLEPGGVAILQVPIALKLDTSIELGLESSETERVEKLGQDDHLRLLTAADYTASLAAAGFEVEDYDAFEADATTATAWALDPFEVLFVCRKPT